MNLRSLIFILPVLVQFSCAQTHSVADSTSKDTSMNNDKDSFKVVKTDEEWKKTLSPEQYRVLREKGTERPFSGEYETHWDTGVYVCKACGAELFRSNTKFDAHCGWPSFYESVDKSAVKEIRDVSHGMVRTEVVCANCGGHLGHVFDDGPQDKTGLRYCINSVSLGFEKKK